MAKKTPPINYTSRDFDSIRKDLENYAKRYYPNTYKDFKISESNMLSNQIVIKSIETSLNSLKEEYNIGTKTITDLVNEEEKLLKANVNYLNSKKDFLTNYFKLKSLDGSLIKLFEHYIPATN